MMLSARAAAPQDVKPDDIKILEKTSRRVGSFVKSLGTIAVLFLQVYLNIIYEL